MKKEESITVMFDKICKLLSRYPAKKRLRIIKAVAILNGWTDKP